MNNRVIARLHQLFQRLGCDVLRFNFRGVGRSQGAFSRGEGELADAATALDWIQKKNQNARESWICGYSFGAWIGMQLLMRRPEVVGFISLSAPVNLFDFNFISPCPASGVFIHGETDQVASLALFNRAFDKFKPQKGMVMDKRIIDNADHFYSQSLEAMEFEVEDYFRSRHQNRPSQLNPPQ